MSELLESVKRLAEAQRAIPEGAQLEGTMYGPVDAAYFVQQASTFDFPALAKHLARLERVEVAAKEYRKRYLAHTDHTSIHVLMAGDALDAALSENPDVE